LVFVIVILANRWDQTPGAIASRWAARDVAVLTAPDLSVAGWHQDLSGIEGGIAVAERKLIPKKEITGVLTLLPCVYEEELVDIASEDRRYVAAEMTAFLLCWLSRLKCPVLNRPTPTCLSGPYWRREKWVHVAAQAGIPVQPVRRHAAPPGCSVEEEPLTDSATVTVIGERIFGEADPGLQRQARCLAGLAGVDLLAVRYSSPEHGARFVSADIFPNLSDGCLADAVLEFLRGEPARYA
jgi:hypothetical protein